MYKILAILASILLTANLISYAEQQSSKVENNMPNLFKEIKANHNEAVLNLIKANPSLLETRNSEGQTPLMLAIYQDNQELIKKLILAGANVNAQDNIKNSPFLYAGAEGYYDTVKLALAHGAAFDIYNRYGGTALIPAAEKGHVKNVELLANTPNYPIDHVNNLGWTALMEAIVLSDGGAKHVQIIEILLKAGANPNIPDNKGISALTHAKQKGYTDIVKLLESYHAK